MRVQKQHVVLLSAYTHMLNNVENKMRHHKLKARIEKLFPNRVFETQGVYKGESEESLGVIIDGQDDVEILETQANYFQQESILYLDNEGRGTLVTLRDPETSTYKNLGFYVVSDKKPMKDDYTFIPSTETYFYFNRMTK